MLVCLLCSLPEVIIQIMEMLEVQRENQNTVLMLQESFFTGSGRKSTVLPSLEICRENRMDVHLCSQIFPQECSEKQIMQESDMACPLCSYWSQKWTPNCNGRGAVGS